MSNCFNNNIFPTELFFFTNGNVKDTFLVFIDEGLTLVNEYIVADALKSINHDIYSQINYVYYVSGEEVAEIPLSTP